MIASGPAAAATRSPAAGGATEDRTTVAAEAVSPGSRPVSLALGRGPSRSNQPAIRSCSSACSRARSTCCPRAGSPSSSPRDEPLRVKFGVDPTSPDIHLGHCVVLSKLRAFQDAGHTVVLIIGDYTARRRRPERARRDPAGALRGADRGERAHLPGAGVRGPRPRPHRGAAQQRVAARWRAKSCSSSSAGSRSRGCSSATISAGGWSGRSRSRRSSCSTRCSRAMTRWRSRPTSSSAAPTRSSTCCSAATCRTAYGQQPQSILTMPILPGTDGVRKMSKSYDNYVGVTDPPEEMFGKLMSIPDCGDGRVLPAPARRASSIANATPVRRSASSPGGSQTASTATARAPRPSAASTRCTCEASCRTRSRSFGVPVAGGPVHLPALIASEFELSTERGAPADRAGRGAASTARSSTPRRSTSMATGSSAGCSRSASAGTGACRPRTLDRRPAWAVRLDIGVAVATLARPHRAAGLAEGVPARIY